MSGGTSKRAPPGRIRPATVPVAAQRQEQVEAVAAHPAEIRGGGLIGDVAGDGAEIAEVIGEPLELERDAADGLGPRRLLRPRQRLDGAAVSPTVADHRVARDRFGDQHRAGPVELLEQPLDSAMLVSQHDVELEHLLPQGLVPEMPWLDDPGVDRAHRDLVHVLARDPGIRERLAVVAVQVRAGWSLIRRVPAHRPQVGMTLDGQAALLGDLALEVMQLGT